MNSVRKTFPVLASPDNCTGCATCAAVCPFGAVDMVGDDEGFDHPRMNAERCRSCGRCERACPVLHASCPERVPVRVFAAMALDENLRMNSSSGGVFSLLAESVLSRNGVVFGAAWEGGGRIGTPVLRGVTAESELAVLRGSKYVQARPGTSFDEADKALRAGRPVLFSGTPCQIAGLKAFLGRDDDKLLSVEVICHGCASPAVFQSYVRSLEEEHGGNCTTYTFRSKKNGWTTDSIEASFSNGNSLSEEPAKDPFFRGFVHDLYNRRSCAACAFRNLKSGADVTLGDFWHVSQHLAGMNDGKGTSLVLCNTGKGDSAFSAIMPRMRTCETSFKLSLRVNPALRRSSKPHRNREAFFRQWRDASDLKDLIRRLTALSLAEKVSLAFRRFVYRVRGKIVTMVRGVGK